MEIVRRGMSAWQCDRPGRCVAVSDGRFHGVEYWASRMLGKTLAFPLHPRLQSLSNPSNPSINFESLSAYFGKINGRPKHARPNPFAMARNTSTSSFSGQGKMRAGKVCARRLSNIIRLGRKRSKRVFIWKRRRSIAGGFMGVWGL